MKRQTVSLLLLLAVVSLSGCGDDLAALDATVTGPTDNTFSVSPASPADTSTDFIRPLDFRVSNSDGVPLVDVEVELFANSTNGTGALVDVSTGNFFDSTDPSYFKTKTDDRGVVRTGFIIDLPGCGTADVTISGGVTASVGVTSDVWSATYTIKACPP